MVRTHRALPRSRGEEGTDDDAAKADGLLPRVAVARCVNNSTVEAIAIKNGEIIATGRNGRIAIWRADTRVIDLDRRRVLPGLIDGHLHGLRNGYHCFTEAVRLDNVFSRSQALDLYAAKGGQLAANTVCPC